MTKRSGSANRQRQKQVAVRLSDEEHALVLAVAWRLGVSPPSVLRAVFLGACSATAAGEAGEPLWAAAERAHAEKGRVSP